MRSYQVHRNDMEKADNKTKKEQGFTLVEALVAIALLAFGLLAVASMQTGAIRGNFFASGTTEATAWAQNTLETLLALPYSDPDLTDGNHVDPNPPTGYTIQWDMVNDAVNNFKTVTVTVTYQGRWGTRPAFQLTCIKPQL